MPGKPSCAFGCARRKVRKTMHAQAGHIQARCASVTSAALQTAAAYGKGPAGGGACGVAHLQYSSRSISTRSLSLSCTMRVKSTWIVRALFAAHSCWSTQRVSQEEATVGAPGRRTCKQCIHMSSPGICPIDCRALGPQISTSVNPAHLVTLNAMRANVLTVRSPQQKVTQGADRGQQTISNVRQVPAPPADECYVNESWSKSCACGLSTITTTVTSTPLGKEHA